MTKRLLDENHVLRRLYKEIDRAGGQSAWARRSGIDRVHLNKVLKGERPLSPNIIRALKLKKVYVAHDRERGATKRARTGEVGNQERLYPIK
jgi:predicted transcriptional regulator